ncbi:MAG: hypothetical protein HRU38_23410 [Saccharospirillaceae bacterium]|nr:hypothetical protein [Saccharospirillaceae bacterium]
MSLEQTPNASELLEVARKAIKAAFAAVVHDSDGVKFTKVGKRLVRTLGIVRHVKQLSLL